MINDSDSCWFPEELTLSQGYHSMHMDSQEMIIQANPGSTRKKMGKVLEILLLTRTGIVGYFKDVDPRSL